MVKVWREGREAEAAEQEEVEGIIFCFTDSLW